MSHGLTFASPTPGSPAPARAWELVGTAARPANPATPANTVSSKYANRRGNGRGRVRQLSQSPGWSEKSLPGSCPSPVQKLSKTPCCPGASSSPLSSCILYILWYMLIYIYMSVYIIYYIYIYVYTLVYTYYSLVSSHFLLPALYSSWL